ncbi:carbohydrate ABC transporter permease [Robinsoniella sp. KNHs210]|uniref:carbohydrate ABC transporter permease n=1 Tax=Robinsoniella sp. KNHs210 TaxID=1469950 RepID=UPI000484A57A|nr:sugar ABC transporter permease [Robinsoniella sp. KNHs210]
MNAKKVYPNYFWFVPLLIYTMIFIIPSILGLLYSFTNWTIYSSSKTFCGLDNYKNLLGDSLFRMGFRNTIIFTIFTTAAKAVIGFALALALNAKIPTKNALRTIYYLPAIFSSLIVGVVFRSILMPKTGLLNTFLGVLSPGLAANDWLGQPSTAMAAVIFVEIWRGAGYCMVLFLAGLQGISSEYYEAATIDGAGGGQKFKSITAPLMMPTLNTVISLSIIGGLKVFDIVIALTKGGPGLSTEVLSTTVYKYLGNGAMGTGSAANMCLTVFVVIVFAVVNYGLGRMEVDQ